MSGKGLPSHLPTNALRRAARRFEDGASKYGLHNWRKGIPLSRYVDGLNRHLWAFLDGETDEDHLGAITWNALCMSETYDMIGEGKLPQGLNDLPDHKEQLAEQPSSNLSNEMNKIEQRYGEQPSELYNDYSK